MSSKSCIRVSALPQVLAAGLLVSCGSGSPSSPGGDVGTISLELVSRTPESTYHLRTASFAIAGPTTTTLTTDSADSEATSLHAKLAVGHYTVTLADGWALYRGATGAAEVRVAATLLSANPASFDVTSNGTTFVPFRFATDGLVIATGATGTVEVSAEVNELRGLALLAGDPVEAGSADGVGAAARFDTPTTLVSDGQGNLYVNDSHNLTIRKLAVATGEVTTIAGSPGEYGYVDGVGKAARFVFPYGMALDDKGNLYISDQFHLRRLVVSTGEVIDLKIVNVPEGTALSIGSALALDASGAPLVVDPTPLPTSSVLTLRRVDPESATATSVAFVRSNVEGIATNGTGTLFLTEASSHMIEESLYFPPATQLAQATWSLAGRQFDPGSADGPGWNVAQFSRPGAIVRDSTGILFVADPPNGTIRKIVVIDNPNNSEGNVTTVVGQAGVPGGPTPGPLPAVLGRPVGVAVLPNGALAIADGNAIYIARF